MQLELKKNIDDVVSRTGLSELCVTMLAFSQGLNTQIGVGIHVRIDNNNNVPRFNKTLYKTSVSEHAANGTLTVSAFDPDPGDDGRVTYNITSGDDDSKFSVNSDSGNITVSAALDYSVQAAYNLTVLAQDHGSISQKSSTTHVYVTVLDENDSSPAFTAPVYTASIPEDVSIGSAIVDVRHGLWSEWFVEVRHHWREWHERVSDKLFIRGNYYYTFIRL